MMAVGTRDAAMRAPDDPGRTVRHEAGAHERLDDPVRRVADGERSAMRPCFELLWPVVRRHCLHTLDGDEAGNDAAQRTLEKFFRQAPSYHPSRPALPWVFAHREDIRSVSPLKDLNGAVGAAIVFAPLPGMTGEWLRRVVDCHLARNAAVGYEAASADMPYCPLAVRGARARVESVGDGFPVKVSGSDSTSVDEIVRRAEMLRDGG